MPPVTIVIPLEGVITVALAEVPDGLSVALLARDHEAVPRDLDLTELWLKPGQARELAAALVAFADHAEDPQ